MRKLRFVVVTLALISVLVLSAFQPAAASQSGGSGSLTVDCAAMEAGTPQQQERAQTICARSKGSVSPNDIDYGNCGSFSFWLFNNADGSAEFYVHVESSLAPISGGYWNANWFNWTINYGTWTNGTIFPDSPGSYDGTSTQAVYTGDGYVTASVAGDGSSEVDLVDGTVCDLMYNSDSVTVTG